jgi:hypothetical protein
VCCERGFFISFRNGCAKRGSNYKQTVHQIGIFINTSIDFEVKLNKPLKPEKKSFSEENHKKSLKRAFSE